MKEQLVTFDTAKLAKDRGFNIKTLNAWAIVNKETRCRIINASELFDNEYYAPTQSLLQKWLREKHNIDVVILPERYKDGINYLVQAQKWDLTTNEKSNPNFVVKASYWFNDNNEYPSFEEALEKGLQEALKLIK